MITLHSTVLPVDMKHQLLLIILVTVDNFNWLVVCIHFLIYELF